METAARKLELAGIPFERLALPEQKASAAAMGYPASYVASTVVYRADGAPVAVAYSGDRRVDEAKLRRVLGCAALALTPASELEATAGVGPESLSPLSVRDGVRVIWDEGLRRGPVVAIPGDAPGEALKIDTRHLFRLKPDVADVATRPGGPKLSAYDVLLERGFVDRVTDEARARELMADPDVAAYIGFDPTADSLHVGSLVPIMAMANVQRNGGRIIAVVGGGTALIGDPSGKTEMRQMLTREEATRNAAGLRRQLSTYLTLDDRRHLMVDNADWLAAKNYIEFLREVGVHFSVNRMLTAECFRARLEKGLSFIEFNYMLLQAYDFVALAERQNCLVQMGGSDQWGNICAGIDLGRRMKDLELAGVTFPLLESASGRKFGKTEAGNVWLDAGRTSPHEFFQFWRNADDLDVERFLGLFTLLPMEAVRELCDAAPGPALNEAKKVLAFATTRMLHGEGKGVEALATAEALFGGVSRGLAERLAALGLLSGEGAALLGAPAQAAGLPTVEVEAAALAERGGLLALLAELGLCRSRSEARRLVHQGGVYLNEVAVNDPAKFLDTSDFRDGRAVLRVGKKKHGVVRLKA